MENITINSITWRKAKDGKDYASINYDFNTKTGLSAWVNKAQAEQHNLFALNSTIEADTYDNKGYKNITAVKKDGNTIKWDRDGNIASSAAPSVSPPQVSPPIEIPPILETEISSNNGNTMERISAIVSLIKQTHSTMTANQLSDLELELSALNVEVAKQLSANSAKANQMDLDYHKQRHEKVKELQAIDEKLSDTKAKTHAEADLWESKVALTIQQDKVKSNEVIMSGINNLLYAIKDRLKHI